MDCDRRRVNEIIVGLGDVEVLGFTARDLSDLGHAPEPGSAPSAGEASDEFERFRSQLDERAIRLNAASTHLTDDIRSVWNTDTGRSEASTVRVTADGQLLKVTVQDELGVEIELDQRSEGFQWLVSFFVVLG